VGDVIGPISIGGGSEAVDQHQGELSMEKEFSNKDFLCLHACIRLFFYLLLAIKSCLS